MRDGKPALGTALSSVLPPPVIAIGEVATGQKLWEGMPIEPRWMEKFSPPERYYRPSPGRPGTPEIYKKAGEVLNISPLVTQRFVRSLVGRAEQQVTEGPGKSFSRTFLRPAGGKIEREIYKVEDAAEQGYSTTRRKVMDLFRQKASPPEIVSVVQAWNEKAMDLVKEWERLGMPADKFGRAITFDQKDMKTLYVSAMEEERGKPSLQRRWGR
jgi:hypothetical protein